MFKQYLVVFLYLLCLFEEVHAQSMRKVQWPLNWSKQKVVIDLTLYDHVKNGSSLVSTQIPDKRSAQLYLMDKPEFYPNIKSILYVSKDKVVLVNYTRGGKYIDHRIIAATNHGFLEKPTYAIVKRL